MYAILYIINTATVIFKRDHHDKANSLEQTLEKGDAYETANRIKTSTQSLGQIYKRADRNGSR